MVLCSYFLLHFVSCFVLYFVLHSRSVAFCLLFALVRYGLVRFGSLFSIVLILSTNNTADCSNYLRTWLVKPLPKCHNCKLIFQVWFSQMINIIDTTPVTSSTQPPPKTSCYIIYLFHWWKKITHDFNPMHGILYLCFNPWCFTLRYDSFNISMIYIFIP